MDNKGQILRKNGQKQLKKEKKGLVFLFFVLLEPFFYYFIGELPPYFSSKCPKYRRFPYGALKSRFAPGRRVLSCFIATFYQIGPFRAY